MGGAPKVDLPRSLDIRVAAAAMGALRNLAQQQLVSPLPTTAVPTATKVAMVQRAMDPARGRDSPDNFHSGEDAACRFGSDGEDMSIGVAGELQRAGGIEGAARGLKIFPSDALHSVEAVGLLAACMVPRALPEPLKTLATPLTVETVRDRLLCVVCLAPAIDMLRIPSCSARQLTSVSPDVT